MIKPGCLCLLKNLLVPRGWNGRVVIAVRFKPGASTVNISTLSLVVEDVWEIAAPWIANGAHWQFHSRHLVPISDPDADEDEIFEVEIYGGRSYPI